MTQHTFRTAGAVVLTLTVVAPRAGAQTTPDSAEVARLAGLGQLWGAVKYFHPALADRPIDWDSALVAAIAKVRAARTREQYAMAVDGMLAALGDQATRVVPRMSPSAAPTPSAVATRWARDSTFIITIPDPTNYLGVVAALSEAREEVERAPRVVFDLRARGVELEPGSVAIELNESGIGGLLVPRPLAAPSVRSRMYSGFPAQRSLGFSEYWAGFSTRSGEVLRPAGENIRERRVGFVVDAHSDLPPVALALQRAGLGVIVADGEMASVPGVDDLWTITLPDDVKVAVRVSEVVGAPDGIPPDTVVSGSIGGDRAVDAAAVLLHAPVRAPPPQAEGKAFTAPAEDAYADMQSPPVEYRLLAAFRFWTAIEHFYPYKSLIGEDWERVLVAAIPDFLQAGDSLQYALAVAKLAHQIHDSHGFIEGSPALRAYFGPVSAPVNLRYIEGRLVVTEISADSVVRQSGIRVGDEVQRIDGEAAEALRERLEPYIAVSTPQSLDYAVAGYSVRGDEGSTVTLVVRGADDRERTVRLTRRGGLRQEMSGARPGPTWKVLSGNIGYVDMERLSVPQVDTMFEALRDTKAIIFDNRSYPQGTAWQIAPRLTDKTAVLAARFQRPLAMSPDRTRSSTFAFVQTLPPTDGWRYTRPTVMLVDERTISQAEHTGLFFEAANGTRFVGSPTMGANGDVTNVVLPGNIVVYFTGHDVRHADGRQLQRVGLQPDVVIRPTIKGVREGRDEVLERAVQLIETGR